MITKKKIRLSTILLSFFGMLVSLIGLNLFTSTKNEVYAHDLAEDHVHITSAVQNDMFVRFPFYITAKTANYHPTNGYLMQPFDEMSVTKHTVTTYTIDERTIASNHFIEITDSIKLSQVYSAMYNFSTVYTSTGQASIYKHNGIYLVSQESPLGQVVNSTTKYSFWNVKEASALANKFDLYQGNKVFSYNIETGVMPDTVEPVIDGWEGVYVTSVDNPVTAQFVKGLLYAYDDIDGDVTSRIVIENDGYTANKTTLGMYPILFSVTDLSGNEATITIYVKVVDAVAPTITGPNTLNSNMSAPLTMADIKGTQTVSDNYETIASNKIQVVSEGGYDPTKKGVYNVQLSVTDSSGNVGTKTVAVTVKDDIKPVITGQSSYTKGQSAILTIDTIKAGLSATDNSDGNIPLANIQVVEDNYTGYGTTKGTYTIKFQVTDSSGNASELFKVTVVVSDSMPPVFYVDKSIIFIDATLTMTEQDFIDILIQTGQVNTSMAYTMEVIHNDYTTAVEQNNLSVDQDYNTTVKVSYANGETQYLSTTVRVINQQYISMPIKPWYSSFNGWLREWFGIKRLINLILKALGVGYLIP